MSGWNCGGRRTAAGIFLVLGLFPAGHIEATPGEDVLGKKAPDFELVTTKGDKVRLSELTGKVVVLDFWAVWCDPCRESMPFFEKLQRDHQKDGLVVMGLHVNDRMPSLAEVNRYLEEVGATYRNLVSTTDVDDAFAIVAMPTTYLVDREGILRKRHIGFNPARTPERLLKDVRELLAN
ncbi:MAG TPA: TlpA disulfide reductase family protein [Vicinamibacteria bacterium]|nr:TlpA disulfide reductase family protein [Vicinamibacteria bacterium]